MKRCVLQRRIQNWYISSNKRNYWVLLIKCEKCSYCLCADHLNCLFQALCDQRRSDLNRNWVDFQNQLGAKLSSLLNLRLLHKMKTFKLQDLFISLFSGSRRFFAAWMRWFKAWSIIPSHTAVQGCESRNRSGREAEEDDVEILSFWQIFDHRRSPRSELCKAEIQFRVCRSQLEFWRKLSPRWP